MARIYQQINYHVIVYVVRFKIDTLHGIYKKKLTDLYLKNGSDEIAK
jgi:hypothetical protein